MSEVIVATDDDRIFEAVKKFGGTAVMTSKDHASGTDRVAEVARVIDCGIVVNVQGDEPTIPPENIDLAVSPLLEDASLKISTLRIRINAVEEIADPNLCKVVVNRKGDALYFSRSPIPFFREGMPKADPDSNHKEAGSDYSNWHIHIGIYAFTKAFLLEFTQLPESPLEKIEKLEQLRILQNGISIKLKKTDKKSVGVDHPDAIKKVENILRNPES